jgi:hypothetical protein
MSRKRARYTIGGTCKCREPWPVSGGPYNCPICGHCGKLLPAILPPESPGPDLGPDRGLAARETSP